jgi:hypothetical protein
MGGQVLHELRRNWRLLLYLSPVVLSVATLATVMVLDALGARCRGAWEDASYSCNALGDVQASIGIVGVALASRWSRSRRPLSQCSSPLS